MFEGVGESSVGVGIVGSTHLISDFPSFSSAGVGVSIKRYADVRFIYSSYSSPHTANESFTNKAFQFAIYPAKDWDGQMFTVETAFTLGSKTMDRQPDISGNLYGVDVSISRNLSSGRGVISPMAGFGFSLISDDFHRTADTSVIAGATFGSYVYFSPYYSRVLGDDASVFGLSVSLMPF